MLVAILVATNDVRDQYAVRRCPWTVPSVVADNRNNHVILKRP